MGRRSFQPASVSGAGQCRPLEWTAWPAWPWSWIGLLEAARAARLPALARAALAPPAGVGRLRRRTQTRTYSLHNDAIWNLVIDRRGTPICATKKVRKLPKPPQNVISFFNLSKSAPIVPLHPPKKWKNLTLNIALGRPLPRSVLNRVNSSLFGAASENFSI